MAGYAVAHLDECRQVGIEGRSLMRKKGLASELRNTAVTDPLTVRQ
jgi:hypothetical protein